MLEIGIGLQNATSELRDGEGQTFHHETQPIQLTRAKSASGPFSQAEDSITVLDPRALEDFYSYISHVY
jgi:hypothetical protein